MSEFREFVRALDIGLAIGKRSAGQFLMGVAHAPDLSREALGEIGREWSRDGQATLDRLRLGSPATDEETGR